MIERATGDAHELSLEGSHGPGWQSSESGSPPTSVNRLCEPLGPSAGDSREDMAAISMPFPDHGSAGDRDHRQVELLASSLKASREPGHLLWRDFTFIPELIDRKSTTTTNPGRRSMPLPKPATLRPDLHHRRELSPIDSACRARWRDVLTITSSAYCCVAVHMCEGGRGLGGLFWNAHRHADPRGGSVCAHLTGCGPRGQMLGLSPQVPAPQDSLTG